MEPEARLDALLSQRHEKREGVSINGATPLEDGSEEAQETSSTGKSEQLDPLLRAADRFAVWGGPEPSPSFANQLEATLLARFAAASEGITTPEGLPAIVPPAISDLHSPPNVEPAPSLDPLSEQHPAPQVKSSALHWRSRKGRPPVPAALLRWQAAVAALLLVGIGVVSVLATVAGLGWPGGGPGQTPASTPSASGLEARVRAHLRSADVALTAFNTAIAQHSGDQAYQNALTRFSTEVAAAASDLATAPAGQAYETLAAQLSALRDRGRHDLRAALPILTWPMRATVTGILGALNDTIPKIAHTGIAGASSKDAYVWTLTVQGAGFSPGAVLLVDDQPTGATLSVSATTLVAQVSSAVIRDGSHQIGVGNPDGTAVNGDFVTFSQPDDHGGHGGSGGGAGPSSSGGGSRG